MDGEAGGFDLVDFADELDELDAVDARPPEDRDVPRVPEDPLGVAIEGFGGVRVPIAGPPDLALSGELPGRLPGPAVDGAVGDLPARTPSVPPATAPPPVAVGDAVDVTVTTVSPPVVEQEDSARTASSATPHQDRAVTAS